MVITHDNCIDYLINFINLNNLQIIFIIIGDK